MIQQLLIGTLPLGPPPASVRASDGSVASVQSVHDNPATQDGDIITLPNGTFTWTTQLSLSKAVVLQGNTTVNSDLGTANDLTVVQGNTPDRVISLRGGQRITGITFATAGFHGVRSNGGIYHDPPDTSGNVTRPIRIDHCHFNDWEFSPQFGLFNPNYGVMDHNVFTGLNGQIGIIHCWWQYYNGFDHGDGSFAEPAGFGGPKFFFIENNYIAVSSNLLGGGSDITHGGKLVWRYNEFFNAGFGSHGLSRTFQDGRGGRAYEIYNNKCHNTYQIGQSWDGPDSGSWVVHDNTYLDLVCGDYSSAYYRVFYYFGSTFGSAHGGNDWDYNATEANGSHVDGRPAFVFASGTLTGAAWPLLTDSSKSWSTDQWIGYSIKIVGRNDMGVIIGNTSNSITISNFYNAMTFNVGDSYQIYKCLVGMDQPGLGQANPIVRGSPAWPQAVAEPCYAWNNIHVGSGRHVGFSTSSQAPTIKSGIHYFNDTVMPGYTPYMYPHPLVM